MRRGLRTNQTDGASLRRAARKLIRLYAQLARSEKHLLVDLLQGQVPGQWEHYPSDDAISSSGRYQWFYHWHSPEDRSANVEHGHFHLFARMEAAADTLDIERERQFLAAFGVEDRIAPTRHLLCIGVNPFGLPISMFTVNSWVTGDSLLSGKATQWLLQELQLDTGYPAIDAWIMAVIDLYAPEIRSLLVARDKTLQKRAASGPGAFDDEALEVLSEYSFDVDQRIAAMTRPLAPRAVSATTESRFGRRTSSVT